MVVIELLTLRAVKLLEQLGDDAFLDGEFGFERSDFRGELFDELFGRLDG